MTLTKLLLLLICTLSLACRSSRTTQQRSSDRQTKGVSITHLASMDEGVAFPWSNSSYSIWFELWPSIPKYRESSSVQGMNNPEYERWVRAHEIEYLSAQVQRLDEANWHNAASVEVDYAYGSETSVFNEGDLRSRRSAADFQSLPSEMRLANRQYIFHFIDTFSIEGTRIRLNYSLRRPDGSRAIVDTVIKYRWHEYGYEPD